MAIKLKCSFSNVANFEISLAERPTYVFNSKNSPPKMIMSNTVYTLNNKHTFTNKEVERCGVHERALTVMPGINEAHN